MKLLLIISFCCILPLTGMTQIRKNKVQSYFGLQYKFLMPTNFIGDKTLELDNNGYSNITTQKFGYVFGATVRVNLTKLIALETGLDFTQRNFSVDMMVPDSNAYLGREMRFIEYGLPINALMYIQLSNSIFMNASIGPAITFKPTDVKVFGTDGDHSFTHYGISQNKVGLDINGNLGFELRTKKNGFFYIGGSARIPFFPIFEVLSFYDWEGLSTRTSGPIEGNYFSIDLKYFFPNIKNKGVQFNEGPIE